MSATSIKRDLDQRILETLAELGGRAVGEKDLKFGQSWMIPELYQDNLGEAINFLVRYRDQMEEPVRFSRHFPYKHWDGAIAVMRGFQKVFGTSGTQVNTFFSPAGYKTIPISPWESLRVPWGKITVPIFRGTLTISAAKDEDGYDTFLCMIDAPKKYEGPVEGLFKLIEDELENSSIYKGKAIDGSSMPQFLDLTKIDINQIVYSSITMDQLVANLWTPITHPDICRKHGIDPKRANLLEGPYGTGKTLCAHWTAKLCEESGRTFIMCNPKDNNIWECLKTGQLYQPSCVFIEDIDRESETTDRAIMARLLDEFDGLKAKGNDIMLILTTNKVEAIHKAMLRPGRLDAVIHIGELDEPAVEKLIKSRFAKKELGDINFHQVYETMHDFTPAFMKEVCEKVKLYSIARVGGDPEPYVTADFLAASEEMRAHYEQHIGAKELQQEPTLDAGMRKKIVEVLDEAIIEATDQEWQAKIKVKKGS